MLDCFCDSCEEDQERGPTDHDEYPPEGCLCTGCRDADAADACWNDHPYDWRDDD